MTPGTDGKERRISPRRKEMKVVRFAIEGKRSNCLGISGNVSDTGLFLITICEIEPGDNIRIENTGSVPFGAGRVRWIRKDDVITRAGVECTKFVESGKIAETAPELA